jgi:HD-GYP domain-containing protein (c-di-GMP phosphodiesterase class II)
MPVQKNGADSHRPIQETPLFVVLDSIYAKNAASPISRDKPASQKYTELVARLADVLRNKLQIQAATDARELPFSTLFSIAEMIIYTINEAQDVLLPVMHPEYSGDFLTCHSLNVAFLSCKVGSSLGLEFRQTAELGVAALLHDIGMTKVDADCYNHERELSKEQRRTLEDHPKLGWHFFKKLQDDFPWLLRVILEEHKREHGQGYPDQVDGELHIYSKIIGLCDSFEALSHKRIFRKAFHPADAMKAIIEAKEFLFAKDVLRGMIEGMSMYPVGSLVQLNNKKMALVVQAVPGAPLRPRVRPLEETGEG